jgi:hypothetical protein
MTRRIRYGRSTTPLLCASLLALTLLTGCGEDGNSGDGRDSSKGGASKSSAGKGGSEKHKDGDKHSGKDKDKDKGKDKDKDKQSPPGLPKAADGTDTGACDDGTCEVEMSKGDELRPKSSYGVDRFTVESIKGHVITWTALFSGGQVSMRAEGAEESSTSCTNGSCTGRIGKSKGRLEMNQLVLEFTAIGEDRAVAKVKPK